MRSRRRIWRQEAWLWAPPLALLLLGLGGLAVFQSVLAGNARSGEQGLSSRQTELQELLTTRREVEALADRLATNHEKLVAFYGDRLGTEGGRLTRILGEVQELARRSGLEPSAFNYPDDAFDSYGLVRKAVVFNVDGSYVDLRRFVNFLELSESFLALEDVALSESGQKNRQELRIALRLSTFFLAEGVDAERLASDPSFAPQAERTRP